MLNLSAVTKNKTREMNELSEKRKFDCPYFVKSAWKVFYDSHQILYLWIAVPQ